MLNRPAGVLAEKRCDGGSDAAAGTCGDEGGDLDFGWPSAPLLDDLAGLGRDLNNLYRARYLP